MKTDPAEPKRSISQQVLSGVLLGWLFLTAGPFILAVATRYFGDAQDRAWVEDFPFVTYGCLSVLFGILVVRAGRQKKFKLRRDGGEAPTRQPERNK